MTPSEVLHPELSECHRQFRIVCQDVDSLVRGLSEAQFNWRPDPGAWSIGQCLQHLAISTRLYLPNVDGAIDAAMARGDYGAGPYRYGTLERWFVRTQDAPPKRKFKTFRPFEPSVQLPLEATVTDFHTTQEVLIQRLRRANGLDLARAKLRLPTVRFGRLSLGNCFQLLAAHQRRHIWQAHHVRTHESFPEVQ